MSRDKQFDLFTLIAFPIILALGCFYYEANFIVSTLLLFGVPLLYLIFRMLGNVKILARIAVFAFLFSIPATLLFDYLVASDKGWFIKETIFSFRFLGIVAFEQFIWGFLWVFFVVAFYEYFLEDHRKRPLFDRGVISKRMESFSILIFSALVIFILIAYINPRFLQVSYAYLVVGTLLVIIPLSIFIFKFPNLIFKFSKITAYFIFLNLIVEYVGLRLDHWSFPGNHFLGTLYVSDFVLPYEEILLYLILWTPGLLAYYEFLDDDIR